MKKWQNLGCFLATVCALLEEVCSNDVAPVFAPGDIREKEVRRLKDRDRLAQEKKMVEAHDLALQLMEKAEAMERE